MHVDEAAKERNAQRVIEAERTVLGSVITDSTNLMGACLRLQPEHFVLGSHRTVFQACLKLADKQATFDLRDVRTALGAGLDALGGDGWLAGLLDGIPRRFEPSRYADDIIEAWRVRRGLEICAGYAARFELGEPSVETLAALQADVMDAIADGSAVDEPHVEAYSDAAFADLMERAMRQSSSGLRFGMTDLDAWTSGMQPGQVTVVGARSGVGKSSLMKQATVANCSAGVPVTLFSLEMSRQEILEGIWSIVSGVEFRKVSRPYLLCAPERDLLALACEKVKAWPLRIYDKADLYLDQIVSLGRLNVRQFGAQLVCVDYAQNVEAEGRDERTKVMAVSRKLTKMAKDEGCHLMLLSQLRKVPHEQYSKPPTVADLRETGQLENDAHMIVLLHRPWDDETCRVSEDASVIVGKIRRGQTGAIAARFNPANLTFQGVGA